MGLNYSAISKKIRDISGGESSILRTYYGQLFKENAFYMQKHTTRYVKVEAQESSYSTSLPQQKSDLPVENLLKTDYLSQYSRPLIYNLSEYSNLDILFLGDTKDLYASDYMPEDDLLDKMIKALKHPLDKIARCYSVDIKNDDFAARFGLEISFTRPKVIVTLGAAASHFLLKNNKKLSHIHGQFFEEIYKQDENEHKFVVVPLFHPDFLVINQNMKRTTWSDLQKILSHLNSA